MAPQTLILDTGPLWELVLYSAVHDLGYASLDPDLKYLRSRERYDRLTAFIAQFGNRVTTPHVVAEISAWTIRKIQFGRDRFWKVIYSEFRRMGMDENTLTLLSMPEDLVISLGAVDVSVVKVASALGPGNSTVLSIDGSLISECKRARLPTQHLLEIIEAEVV